MPVCSNNIVTKIVRYVHSENSPASKLTENNSLFSNIPENRRNSAYTNSQHKETFNSLPDRSADNTPKKDSKGVRTQKMIAVYQHTFQVQRRFNTSQEDSTSPRSEHSTIYTPTGHGVTWNHLVKSGSLPLPEISRKFWYF
ncbi:hypothetical protein AVEN_153167-1 [Araneus ventricosus]|uniref:Uncharacterized protein n=1 Tax=Araneus ventricosus TaxID=182803 RepID=A0A4Y1ZUV2_ARAVE|nr:hypothetical protein AVEN_153167-1 [Araneus ventricosus]